MLWDFSPDCGTLPKDALSQITNRPISLPPVDGLPIGLFLGSVCIACTLHPTFPLMCNLYPVLWVIHQNHVSSLSA
jgi:hypothetical protein